jgi:ABC-type transporter Mla subunit MlaD
MPLQDLTPQLRTRLSRVERVVGLFVALAVLLMAFGFVYYLYHTAQRKGWFLIKAPYFTFVESAVGLKVGDPVKLMGFDVGEITRITAQPATDPYWNVYVEFVIKEPYYGYLWSDSRARVSPADFLGKRIIEVTKGTNGYPTYLDEEMKLLPVGEALRFVGKPGLVFTEQVFDATGTNALGRALQPLTREGLKRMAELGSNLVQVADRNAKRDLLTALWDDRDSVYVPYRKTNAPYWLMADESPALTERLEGLVTQLEAALPGVLDLTNQLALVLSNSASLTAHADLLVMDAHPAVTNLALIAAMLREPKGALGEWLLPTNLNLRLNQTLASANTALTNADASLSQIVSNLNVSLGNLADLTGSLSAQVKTNDQILSQISRAIVHADDLIQGLKRHWLLRSAFKEKPSPTPTPPRR